MEQDLNKHIATNLSFLEGKKILITISGGIDSVVLTHLLYKLNYNISLAHCNFQLRGIESDLDEEFVNDLSKELAIDVFTIRFNTKEYSEENKTSTQISARELRYRYFKELTEEHSFDFVLTAHHADDNLETFLINLTRGTGLGGLTGIPVRNGNIVRPLLPFSRLSIINYAEENNIVWREDKSNSEKKYVRNKIRHQIVPVLKEINPSLLASFNKTSNYLQESLSIVDDKIIELSKEIIKKEKGFIKFSIKKILKLSSPKAYLYQFLKEYNFNEWDNVFDLLTAESGKYLRSNSHMLLKDREFLVLSLLEQSIDVFEEKYYIDKKKKVFDDLPVKIHIKNTKKTRVDSEKSILVDKKLVFYPLLIRKWQEGDVFYPTGMFGKKKVSKYFKDEKLSLFEKQNTWLLCTKEDEIIWIIGMRPDRRFEININTKNILKISI